MVNEKQSNYKFISIFARLFVGMSVLMIVLQALIAAINTVWRYAFSDRKKA